MFVLEQKTVTHLLGPVRNARNAKTTLECFQLLVDDRIIQVITTNTNTYLHKQSNVLYAREREIVDRQIPIKLKDFGLLINCCWFYSI